MEEFTRQGLSATDSIKATAAVFTLARLSTASTDQVVQGLVATLATFNEGSSDYIKVIDKLAALDAKFATSAADIVEGIKRVYAVADDAELEFDKLLALIAATKEISSRSESVIGNALKTIITNLQNKTVQYKLEKLGVVMRDVDGNILPIDMALGSITSRFKAIDEMPQVTLLELVAGKFLADTMKSMIEAIETGLYIKILNTIKSY